MRGTLGHLLHNGALCYALLNITANCVTSALAHRTQNLCIMSKITLSAVLTLIRLAIVLLGKGCRLVYSIIDLCDDGVVNQSAERPEWYQNAIRVISLLEDASSSLSGIEDSINLS